MDNPDYNKILAEAIAKQNKITNYDLITKKPPDELADFIVIHASEYVCPPKATNKNCEEFRHCGSERCQNCWIDWFEKEVSEDV